MKIRNGFVSNSSSSSFICDSCGFEACGMDMSLSDAEMTECTNGHTICDSHLLKIEEPKIVEDEDEDDDRYTGDPKRCPICQFKKLSVAEGFQYLLKRDGLTVKSLLAEICEKFVTYEDYSKFRKAK